MTSVQSWLLLPSSWCEDEHLYPTPLDRGSEQTLLQPPDHPATSVPSRGERGLSQAACPHLHGFLRRCHFCPGPWRLAPGAPRPPCPEHAKPAAGIGTWRQLSVLQKAWRLCCPSPASRTRCLSSLLSFKLFLRESDNKVASVSLRRRSQEFRSPWHWRFDDFCWMEFRSVQVLSPTTTTFGEESLRHLEMRPYVSFPLLLNQLPWWLRG